MASNIITCFSAGDSEYKDITLPSSTMTCPDRLVIRFQNANEYGETTADTPTHPKLRVYNNEETLLKTAQVCDSTGHYAGQGCYDDDFIIEFMLVDDNNETLAMIKNSDVREKTKNYTIKSDGMVDYTDTLTFTSPINSAWGNIYESSNPFSFPANTLFDDTNIMFFSFASNNSTIIEYSNYRSGWLVRGTIDSSTRNYKIQRHVTFKLKN